MKYRWFLYLLLFFVFVESISILLNTIFQDRDRQERLQIAKTVAPADANNYFYLGLNNHFILTQKDIDSAISFYIAALNRHPFYHKVWYVLAGAYMEKGDVEKGLWAIEKYTMLRPTDPDAIWKAGVFCIGNGIPDRGDKYMKRFLTLVPERQREAYILYTAAGVSVYRLYEKVLPRDKKIYNGFLSYLMELNRVKEAIEFVNLAGHKDFSPRTMLRFCDFLLMRRQFNTASVIWKRLTGVDGTNSIYNGGFEQREALKGCLGWRFFNNKWVQTGFDTSDVFEGDRSLKVVFKGANVGVSVARQYVLLSPSRSYTVKAAIRTDSLTTTNGIYMRVRGMFCPSLHKRSEVVTGTTDWHVLKLNFYMPSTCELAEVSFRRDRSYKFNNKISGTVWIDGVQITQTGD